MIGERGLYSVPRAQSPSGWLRACGVGYTPRRDGATRRAVSTQLVGNPVCAHYRRHVTPGVLSTRGHLTAWPSPGLSFAWSDRKSACRGPHPCTQHNITSHRPADLQQTLGARRAPHDVRQVRWSWARVGGAATRSAGMMPEHSPVPLEACRAARSDDQHRTVPMSHRGARRPFAVGIVTTQNGSRR